MLAQVEFNLFYHSYGTSCVILSSIAFNLKVSSISLFLFGIVYFCSCFVLSLDPFLFIFFQLVIRDSETREIQRTLTMQKFL